uniref:Uncharacterized protein n=1 Tax=Glossina palpalis gambiensis TaxID=67801 RepID=A0A1B0BSY0_9MUSC
MISRNFENNVANDSILAASLILLFSKNPEKAMENENILLSGRTLHEVSPEKVVSPSALGVTARVVELDLSRVRCVSSIIIHNGFKSRQYYEVICSHRNFLQLKPTVGYIEPDGGREEVTVMPINGPQLSTAPNLQIFVVYSFLDIQATSTPALLGFCVAEQTRSICSSLILKRSRFSEAGLRLLKRNCDWTVLYVQRIFAS